MTWAATHPSFSNILRFSGKISSQLNLFKVSPCTCVVCLTGRRFGGRLMSGPLVQSPLGGSGLTRCVSLSVFAIL